MSCSNHLRKKESDSVLVSRAPISRAEALALAPAPPTPSTKAPVWLIVVMLGIVGAVILLAIYGVKTQYSLAKQAIKTKNPWIVGETMLGPGLVQKI